MTSRPDQEMLHWKPVPTNSPFLHSAASPELDQPTVARSAASMGEQSFALLSAVRGRRLLAFTSCVRVEFHPSETLHSNSNQRICSDIESSGRTVVRALPTLTSIFHAPRSRDSRYRFELP